MSLMHIDRSKIATGRKRPPRYNFDVQFTSEEEKEALNKAKERSPAPDA